MLSGYYVEPEALFNYAQTVGKTAGQYRTLVGPLTKGDILSHRDVLTAEPIRSGGPGAFAQACDDLLENLGALVRGITETTDVIADNLEFMKGALTQTHGVYLKMEAKHGELLDGILRSHDSVNGGGEHGTA